jgi:hypothetical protein
MCVVGRVLESGGFIILDRVIEVISKLGVIHVCIMYKGFSARAVTSVHHYTFSPSHPSGSADG